MKTPTLCIYHGNCADGFGAAWALYKAFPDCEFHAGSYSKPPPDCTDHDVYLVDFSYKRPELEWVLSEANSVTILDHHRTAQDDIQPLLDEGIVEGVFDMERSGAMITWEWFHPDKPIPALIHFVQDRDLWRFVLTATDAVMAVVFSHEQTFDIWDRLEGRLSDDSQAPSLLAEGQALLRQRNQQIESIIKICKRTMTIGDYDVPIANAPGFLASNLAGEMAKGEAFAATYYDSDHARHFSLRVRDGDVDVSAIAKSYGGGGHPKAAGFKMPIGWEGE